MHRLSIFAVALGLLAPSVPAIAQTAGTWSVELGVTQVAPRVRSGDLSAPTLPGTQVDVSDATGVTGAVSYMLDDHGALYVPVGKSLRYTLTGAGRAAGVGKLAEVSILPMTVFGQYRFGAAQAAVRPYVGAGLSYVRFQGETGSAALTALTNAGNAATTLTVRNRWAPAGQVGVLLRMNPWWFVNLQYAKSRVAAQARLSTGQTLDVHLDPDVYSLALGYQF